MSSFKQLQPKRLFTSPPVTSSFLRSARPFAPFSALAVKDPIVAKWLLQISMSPSIAPAVIREQAPKLTNDHLNLLYELVVTWMLAEPARHASSMISGVMELELIEQGKRNFKQSLLSTSAEAPAHPMTHVGSQSQGRQAEEQEQLAAQGNQMSPKTQVTSKQVQQIKESYGGDAEAGIIELVNFYTTVVEQALGQTQHRLSRRSLK